MSHSQAVNLSPPLRPRPRIVLLLEPYDRDQHLGVVKGAREFGWELDDSLCHHDCGMPVTRAEGGPDGAIVTTASCAGAAAGQWREWSGPTVWLGGPGQGASLPSVELDWAKAGRLGARHLLGLGQPQMIYLHSDTGPQADALHEGYAEVCREFGREFLAIGPPAEAGLSLASRREFLRQQLQRLAPPAALMAGSDRDAWLVVEAAAELGIRVPEDLAVLGCGDLEVVHARSPVPISSIDPNRELTGYMAACLLDRALRGRTAHRKRVLIPPKRLVERASTAVFSCEVPAIGRLMQRLRNDYAERLTLPLLAREAGMSVRSLQRAYHAATGSSISDDLMKRRLQAAAVMLRDGTLKLESVARAVGLGSANHLCHLFKERYGQTPNQWRGRSRSGTQTLSLLSAKTAVESSKRDVRAAG